MQVVSRELKKENGELRKLLEDVLDAFAGELEEDEFFRRACLVFNARTYLRHLKELDLLR